MIFNLKKNHDRIKIRLLNKRHIERLTIMLSKEASTITEKKLN